MCPIFIDSRMVMLIVFLLYSVRREDLLSPRSSREPSPDIDPGFADAYHERLASMYGVKGRETSIIADDKEIDKETNGEDGEGTDGEEEFAFRLFGGEEERRIVIREEDPGTGAFVSGTRDPRVFILKKAEGEDKSRFERMAVSGEEVLRERERRAWGLEVPWRVVVWKKMRRQKEGSENDKKGILDGKKRKLGKKRRIILREKMRKVEEARRRREEGEREKEEREREKRTRRNREKKVKRKLKEKAKKAGGGEGEGGGVEVMDVDEGSG